MSFKQKLISQFGKPQGILGRLAGTIMANRPSNQERNRWTISLLEIQPSDEVLEIGFGTYQPRNKNATNEDTQKMGGKISGYLKQAGFIKIQLETKTMKPVNVICVIGHKS